MSSSKATKLMRQQQPPDKSKTKDNVENGSPVGAGSDSKAAAASPIVKKRTYN